MRIQPQNTEGKITGYILWLSARETRDWACRPGAAWPCSTISHNRIMVAVDGNGLYDLTVNGREDNGAIDGHELDTIVADHVPKNYRHLWPTWE